MDGLETIHDSFPDMGVSKGAHEGSQSEAPSDVDMAIAKGRLGVKLRETDFDSATSRAYRRGDYSEGTYKPWHPNEK